MPQNGIARGRNAWARRAIVGGLTLLTPDPLVTQYPVATIWRRVPVFLGGEISKT